MNFVSSFCSMKSLKGFIRVHQKEENTCAFGCNPNPHLEHKKKAFCPGLMENLTFVCVFLLRISPLMVCASKTIIQEHRTVHYYCCSFLSVELARRLNLLVHRHSKERKLRIEIEKSAHFGVQPCSRSNIEISLDPLVEDLEWEMWLWTKTHGERKDNFHTFHLQISINLKNVDSVFWNILLHVNKGYLYLSHNFEKTMDKLHWKEVNFRNVFVFLEKLLRSLKKQVVMLLYHGCRLCVLGAPYLGNQSLQKPQKVYKKVCLLKAIFFLLGYLFENRFRKIIFNQEIELRNSLRTSLTSIQDTFSCVKWSNLSFFVIYTTMGVFVGTNPQPLVFKKIMAAFYVCVTFYPRFCRDLGFWAAFLRWRSTFKDAIASALLFFLGIYFLFDCVFRDTPTKMSDEELYSISDEELRSQYENLVIAEPRYDSDEDQSTLIESQGQEVTEISIHTAGTGTLQQNIASPINLKFVDLDSDTSEEIKEVHNFLCGNKIKLKNTGNKVCDCFFLVRLKEEEAYDASETAGYDDGELLLDDSEEDLINQ